ncbi:hypothetical protein [uncultured Xylophilus sp.]|uniref:hypothetical protein n=1 Tax=uncultured Xylophilus sp. TaxID=296832 RepID=UPI0025D1BF62|nr:hypothetical protein [uncultured Xylophilus sp.]
MTARPQTSLAAGAPWPKTDKPARRNGPRVDLTQLSIVNEPPPMERCRKGRKYDALFDELQPDRRIKCPPDMTNPVSNALRTWLKDKKIAGRVLSRKHCPDGFGGVWWVQDRPGAAPRKAGRP